VVAFSLVATAAEDRLNAQSVHFVCGSHCDRRHNWRRTSRLENQTTKKKSRRSRRLKV
jgi:hypothetical protein